MEKVEAKIRTSLRSKKQGGKKGLDEPGEANYVARRKNSDDEDDEFFDRTKQYSFNNTGSNSKSFAQDLGVETYETIKTKLENLIKERIKLTDEMSNSDKVSSENHEEEDDELEAYMK